jgi:hypothetical protein
MWTNKIMIQWCKSSALQWRLEPVYRHQKDVSFESMDQYMNLLDECDLKGSHVIFYQKMW